MIQRYPVPLALLSFLPVLLSALSLFFVAQMLKRKNEITGELSLIGTFLIIAGNLLGAIAKLLNATKGHDPEAMSRGMFLLIAPGTVCLAWALWKGLRDRVTEMTAGQVWLLPLFLNAGLLALTAATKLVKGGRAWVTLLLTVMTVASIAVGVQLALRALHYRLAIVAGLFLLSMVMSLTLNRTTGEGASAEAAEWANQVSSTIAQAAFAFAAYKLSQTESST